MRCECELIFVCLPGVVPVGVLLGRRLRRLARRDGEAPVEEVLVVLVLVERRLRRQAELGKLAWREE